MAKKLLIKCRFLQVLRISGLGNFDAAAISRVALWRVTPLEYRNHVWSYDFVEDRTHNRRKYRMLNVLDEFTHECLAIRVARKLKAIDVIDVSDLFILPGVPAHIRSDNGN